MTATHDQNYTLPAAPVLYVALELGWNTWKLAFTIGAGQKPRIRTIRARALDVLLAEIQAAKARFGVPEDAKVISCYEAGRDGGWYWWLVHQCRGDRKHSQRGHRHDGPDCRGSPMIVSSPESFTASPSWLHGSGEADRWLFLSRRGLPRGNGNEITGHDPARTR